MKKNKKYIKNFLIILVIIGYLFFVFYKASIREVQNKEMIEDEKILVVTSFYPMYLQTKALTKDVEGIEVVNMANSQVGCLHDYTLTTEDAKKLHQADVFVINGVGEEGFLEKVYTQNKSLKIIDASSEWLEHYEETHEEASEDIHHEEEAIGHEGHQHGPINTHVWLSLEGGMMQLETIANELSEIDPTNKAIYQANKEKEIMRLQSLEAISIRDKKRAAVQVHDTFSYLTEDCGVEIVAVIPEGTYENPSPRQIQDIIETMNEKDARVILADQRYKDLSILGIIQRETGCEIIFLDDMTYEREQDYVERMEENIRILSEVK